MSVTFYTTNHFWHHYPGQKGPAETDAALAADDADQHRKETARHQAEKEREQRHIRFD